MVKNILPHGSVWRNDVVPILLLAWPLILTNFAHVALTTIDIVVLGTFGATEIAAGGLAIALFNQLRTTGTGLVTGVSNLVAKANARNDDDAVRALLAAGFFWATLAACVFMLLLFLLEQPLLWIGQEPTITSMAIHFLAIASPGLLPCLWFQTLRHFTVGLKQPGPLLMITLVSIALTAGLNYVLVFGKLGLPTFGFQGVALTMMLVFFLSFIMLFGVARKNKALSPYLGLSNLRLTRNAIFSVWKLGLPIAGTYASEAGFFSVLTLLIGTLGVEALAAQTVINQVVYIVFMISAGISHAASIHISEACGRAEYHRARRLGYIGLIIGILAMIAVAVPYVTMPNLITSLFISAEYAGNAQTTTLVAAGLGIATVLQIFDAGQNIGNGVLRGTGDTAGPFRISLIGYWLVGLPCAYALGMPVGMGIHGVWIGLTTGLAATSILLFASFERRIAILTVAKPTMVAADSTH